MGRLITFCVLLCLSSLIAAIPFPDPFPENYNTGYAQPQYETYNEYPRPQNQYEQKPEFGNDAYNSVRSTYGGNSYGIPSSTAQNYPRYVNQEPSSHLASNGPTAQQIQEEIENQIKEQQAAINDRLANQIRSQNGLSNQNLRNVAEPYLNTPSVTSDLKAAFVYEQQLPGIEAPRRHWESSPVKEYEQGAVARAHAVTYPQPEPVQNKVTPYQKIYHHLVQQPRPATGSNPQNWQNLWRKYSNSAVPPKNEKRYLVIHPDGSTQYVDKIESIAQKHPNYVLINGGSMGPTRAITPPKSEQSNNSGNVAPSLLNSPISGVSAHEAPVVGHPVSTVPIVSVPAPGSSVPSTSPSLAPTQSGASLLNPAGNTAPVPTAAHLVAPTSIPVAPTAPTAPTSSANPATPGASVPTNPSTAYPSSPTPALSPPAATPAAPTPAAPTPGAPTPAALTPVDPTPGAPIPDDPTPGAPTAAAPTPTVPNSDAPTPPDTPAVAPGESCDTAQPAPGTPTSAAPIPEPYDSENPTLTATAEPTVSTASEAPATLANPKIPKTSATAKASASVASETPKVSSVPKIPKSPKHHHHPKTPAVPAKPKAPKTPAEPSTTPAQNCSQSQPEVFYLGTPFDSSNPTPIDSAILKKLFGEDEENNAVYFFLVKPQPVITTVINQKQLSNGSIYEETVVTRQDSENSPPTVNKTVRVY